MPAGYLLIKNHIVEFSLHGILLAFKQTFNPAFQPVFSHYFLDFLFIDCLALLFKLFENIPVSAIGKIQLN